jgi:hypothetical protein
LAHPLHRNHWRYSRRSGVPLSVGISANSWWAWDIHRQRTDNAEPEQAAKHTLLCLTCLFVEKKSKNCSTAAATPRLRHSSGHSVDMVSRARKHCQNKGCLF